MQKIRVIVVEDKMLVRKGVVSILKEFPRIGEVRDVGGGKELLQMLISWQPDVILMDLEMPEMDGMEATRQVILKYPDIKVIGLSFHEEEKYILYMIELGAHGYLLKDCDPYELEKAIYAVIDKDFYINELIARVMRNRITHNPVKPKFFTTTEITEREKDLLKYLCREKSSKEIADLLSLSYRTVEKMRSSLILKLGVKGTVGLVKYAIEYGYDL
ncbi:MAG TPA: response regulator transcription factor [Cyclobacteriaceae bacterium]|nr:response regulator transcription factor [Cyclobacteriaceae bacterium]